MCLCAAETTKSPEDDDGGADRRSAVFLWQGRRCGLSGRDGAALQSSSHEDSQVRLQAKTGTETPTFRQITVKLYFYYFNHVWLLLFFNVESPPVEKSITRILVSFNPTGCVIYIETLIFKLESLIFFIFWLNVAA